MARNHSCGAAAGERSCLPCEAQAAHADAPLRGPADVAYLHRQGSAQERLGRGLRQLLLRNEDVIRFDHDKKTYAIYRTAEGSLTPPTAYARTATPIWRTAWSSGNSSNAPSTTGVSISSTARRNARRSAWPKNLSGERARSKDFSGSHLGRRLRTYTARDDL